MWEPPTPEELQAMLPQYEISAILGRGGMGAVYKGRQTKLNRDVAIKLLPETLIQGEDVMNFAARFEQEAQAMANLNHPAIVSVYDFGETAAGQCYFVMEFIDGMDIHQYLRTNGGKLSQEHALAIASHVLDALDYAHSRGIVHRDIKPANVLLSQDGRIKIADFGLAKKMAGSESDQPALTMSNVALGTPDFVAPESLDVGRTPDHRADLYAVGVMLYQMLTGSLPRGQFKTPSELLPELDFRLDEIVSRAMQPDPDDRYGSASEVRSALDLVASQPVTKVEVLDEGEVAPAAVPKRTLSPARKSQAGLWSALAISAAVVVALVALMMPDGAEKEPIAAADIPVENTPPLIKDPVQANPSTESVPVKPGPPAPVVVAQTPQPVVSTPRPEPEIETAEEPKKASTPAVEPTAPPTPKPEPELADKPAPPAPVLIPELATRLNGYLTARETSVLNLAEKYERALTARTDAAADAGDLPLVKAFRGEAEKLTALKKELHEKDGDLAARVTESATLAELDAEAPESLVQLRQTWTSERAKIKTDLDQKLIQSLTAAEKQLTQAREFDKAEAILAFRKSLEQPAVAAVATATVPKPETPMPEPVVAAADTLAENPFGWKPIPEDPFPLARPVRQTTPCRVVAFRMDGKPVDEAEFRKYYGGVPADMGEVVDLEAFTSITPLSDSKYYLFNPIAIRADGNCSAMAWHPEMDADPNELTDVVALRMGRFGIIALQGDGTVVATTVQRRPMVEMGISFDETEKWENIVQIDAGDSSVAGVTAEGEPKIAGDNRHGQGNVPEDLKSGIIDIDVRNSSGYSILAQRVAKGYRFVRIGRYEIDVDLEEGHRFFLSNNPYFADERGRPTTDTMPLTSAHNLKQLGGTNLRDVILMIRADDPNDPTLGIAAACEEIDRWTFWGSTGEIGKFDPDYCAERAEGAWKVFPMYPYVLALKPTSKLTPEDWTGAPPAETATAKPEAPAPPPTAGVSSAKPKFPLSPPSRPTVPGHIVVLRRDGKPLDSSKEHPVAIIPEELGNDVVQLSISRGASNGERIFAAALLENGRFRMWGGERGDQNTVEQLADERKFLLPNCVQVSAGTWSGLFLNEKGELFGTGGKLGISYGDGLKKIPLEDNVVSISNGFGTNFALLENGKLVDPAKPTESITVFENLPRTVAMVSVYGVIALGEDLVWRSWFVGEPGKIAAIFPSEGLIGEPYASTNSLMWIGGDRKVRANYVDQTMKPDNFSILDKGLGEIVDPVAVYMGDGMEAVKSASRGWIVRDRLHEDAVDFSAVAKNAIVIESSAEYYFALMPGEGKK